MMQAWIVMVVELVVIFYLLRDNFNLIKQLKNALDHVKMQREHEEQIINELTTLTNESNGLVIRYEVLKKRYKDLELLYIHQYDEYEVVNNELTMIKAFMPNASTTETPQSESSTDSTLLEALPPASTIHQE